MTCAFRQSCPLGGLTVTVFSAQREHTFNETPADLSPPRLLLWDQTGVARQQQGPGDLQRAGRTGPPQVHGELAREYQGDGRKENLRIEQKLEQHKMVHPRGIENRHSGVADMKVPMDHKI